MGTKRGQLWMYAIWAGLFALGGCQQAVRGPGSDASNVTDASLPADPPCPDNMTAVLASGVAVRFMGAAAGDPETCVQQWNGREYRYFLGFWGNGTFQQASPQQREVLAAVLRGPVGMTATVNLPAQTDMALWRSATVTHEANTSLEVGRHKRAVLKVRVVRQDAPGRADVTAETLYWLDRASGVPLRKQTVTRLADGQTWHITTWEVSALQSASAVSGRTDGTATQIE
jgi:hypothetical protein